jgi:hypothetical protein
MALDGLLGVRVEHWSHDFVKRLVRVALQRNHLLLVHETAAETAIKRRFIQN